MNWGTKIGIVYGVFALAMIGALLRSCGEETHLIEMDYYAKELQFEKFKRYSFEAGSLGKSVSIIKQTDSICLKFENHPATVLRGNTIFKSLANPLYDIKSEIIADNNGCFRLSSEIFRSGIYQVETLWFEEKDTFYNKQQFVF